MSVRVENCCGCLPLRKGLLIWGYFSMTMTHCSLLITLYRLQDDFIISFLSLLGIYIHFFFNIVLVAGLHTNSCCMLEAYNGYLIISMVLEGMVSGLFIPLTILSLFRAEYNERIILIWISVYCAAIVMVFLDLLWKYFILVCVRSLVSNLVAEEKEDQSELKEVIVPDNPY